MTLAIIPARGGSKRIPRKNIKLFNGKPMIAHSILAAQQSGAFSQIIVSTDDEEIAEVAREYGADVPFLRPAELADDFSNTSDVVRHTLRTLLLSGCQFNYVCCLYATAPFVQPNRLSEGMLQLQHNPSSHFSLAVTAFSFPPQRSLSVDKTGFLRINSPELFGMRSQDLPTQYHDAGQFIWGTTSAWLDEISFAQAQVNPIFIPSYLVQDIDTEEDWIRAEAMYQALGYLQHE